jgi:hypothetical protein
MPLPLDLHDGIDLDGHREDPRTIAPSATELEVNAA